MMFHALSARHQAAAKYSHSAEEAAANWVQADPVL